jgi:hypothetical protein
MVPRSRIRGGDIRVLGLLLRGDQSRYPHRSVSRNAKTRSSVTPQSIIRHQIIARNRQWVGLLGVTSLTFLKPRFKGFLMPISARLVRAGAVANQVMAISIVGSLFMGGMLSSFHSHRALFGLLPVWLLIRMACATVDGTMAPRELRPY